MADFEQIWRVTDGWLDQGRYPGYAAAVRVGDRTEVRCGGRLAIEPDSAPVNADSLFRIASVTKPIAAALTLTLVQDGTLALDEPISTWLPEAAQPRVLVDPTGRLDDTVPAERPIVVRDLLASTSGWGVVLEPSPLQSALFERELFPSAIPPRLPADEFVAALTTLPLAFQPGGGWLYHVGFDLLGVVLARAAGRSVTELMTKRVTGPLGMTSTGFQARDTERLAAQYRPEDGVLKLIDPPDGVYATPPPMEQLSSGLVTTAGDVLRFLTAVADGGAPVLTPESVRLLTTDQLDDRQRASAGGFLGPGVGWSLGAGIDLDSAEPWAAPGRWGWTGGTGTTGYVDPQRETASVLLTQRAMAGPDDGFDDFWRAVAEAAD